MIKIIAEAGINHNGSLEKALQLVEIAAHAGADYVKFQTYKVASLMRADAPKAKYQLLKGGEKTTQYELLAHCKLSSEDHRKIKQYCDGLKIGFLSTAFDIASARFLIEAFSPDFLKIPSGEITNSEYLYEHAITRRPMLVSTGMATEGEIEEALGVIASGLEGCVVPARRNLRNVWSLENQRRNLARYVCLLHCVSDYPTKPDEANLRAIDRLKKKFGLDVGLSDHSKGIYIPIAAAVMGISVIEKHFTVSRSEEGPDQEVSVEPDELTSMIDAIREVERARGKEEKKPTVLEMETRKTARKSLVASRAIRKGEYFSRDNLTAKRPGTGRSAMDYWELIGQPATRDYQQDDFIL